MSIQRGEEKKSNTLVMYYLISWGWHILFSTLLGDKITYLRPDKLPLPVTFGKYNMARKITQHTVTSRKIMGVTSAIAVKKKKKSVRYSNQLSAKNILWNILC